MNSELKDLYQQVILDHNKNPRNFGELPTHNHHAKGHNPLCGDHFEVFARLDNGIIKEIKFIGAGCAISKASASIMTTMLIGKTVNEAKALFDEFHHIVTSDLDDRCDTLSLGKLAVFCGVREFPARVKCASLAWHTMIKAIETADENGVQVSTEDVNLN